MHTAICSFEHREIALRARDRLLESGFAERDVHLQHRGPAESHAGEDPRGWEGTDHEIAVSRDMVDKVAGFFVHLFGADRNPKEHEVYEQAVDRGFTVVVVDTRDEAEAARARALLHDLQAADLNVVHRPDQRPLHEIVGKREPYRSDALQGSYHDRASAFDHEPGQSASEAERERAMASGGPLDKPQAPSAARDWDGNGGREASSSERERRGEASARDTEADIDKVGLRYADKVNKPGS